MLIDHHANVNAVDKHGNQYTPLHWAAHGSGYLRADMIHPKIPKYINIAKLLIDNDANVNAKDGFEYTPLHSAAKVGNSQLKFEKETMKHFLKM